MRRTVPVAARITTAAASGNIKLALYRHNYLTGLPRGTPIVSGQSAIP